MVPQTTFLGRPKRGVRADRSLGGIGLGMEPFPPASSTLLLTLDEVAEQLRCTRRTIERLVATKALPSVKIGRAVRVATRDVEDYVERLREQGRVA